MVLVLMCVVIGTLMGCNKADKADNESIDSFNEDTVSVSKPSKNDKNEAIKAMKTVLEYEFNGDGEGFINAAYPDKAIEQMLCGTQYTKETLINNMNRNFAHIKGATFYDFKVVECTLADEHDLIVFDFEYGVMPEICFKMTATYKCKLPGEDKPSLEQNDFTAYRYYNKWYAIVE